MSTLTVEMPDVIVVYLLTTIKNVLKAHLRRDTGGHIVNTTFRKAEGRRVRQMDLDMLTIRFWSWLGRVARGVLRDAAYTCLFCALTMAAAVDLAGEAAARELLFGVGGAPGTPAEKLAWLAAAGGHAVLVLHMTAMAAAASAAVRVCCPPLNWLARAGAKIAANALARRHVAAQG